MTATQYLTISCLWLYFYIVAPPPSSLATAGVTSDSVNIAWSAATPLNLNGNLKGYEIGYRRTPSEVNNEYFTITLPTFSYDVNYTDEGLTSETSYIVEVSHYFSIHRSWYCYPGKSLIHVIAYMLWQTILMFFLHILMPVSM